MENQNKEEEILTNLNVSTDDLIEAFANLLNNPLIIETLLKEVAPQRIHHKGKRKDVPNELGPKEPESLGKLNLSSLVELSNKDKEEKNKPNKIKSKS